MTNITTVSCAWALYGGTNRITNDIPFNAVATITNIFDSKSFTSNIDNAILACNKFVKNIDIEVTTATGIHDNSKTISFGFSYPKDFDDSLKKRMVKLQ